MEKKRADKRGYAEKSIGSPERNAGGKVNRSLLSSGSPKLGREGA